MSPQPGPRRKPTTVAGGKGEAARKKQEKGLQGAIALIQYKYLEQVMDAKNDTLAGMYDNERVS